MPRKPLRARRPARGAKPTPHDRQRAESRAAGTPGADSGKPSTSIALPADLVDAIEKYNAKRAAATPRDRRFAATEYVIDATYQEQHELWWKWAEHCGVPWDAESRGFHAQIGEVAGRPISVDVWWVLIDGVRIAFVDGVGPLVDRAMIEAWQRDVFPCRARRTRHSDAANFAHALSYVRERTGRDPIQRDMTAVDAALAGLRQK